MAIHTKIGSSTLFRTMSKIAFILIFVCSQLALNASVLNRGIKDSTVVQAVSDTIPPDADLFDDFSSIEVEEDSSSEEAYDEVFDEDFCALVQCELYESIWDTVKINPYGVDLKSRKDTTLLHLVHDASCDYFHPVCGTITSDFGFRRSRYHYGIDIDLETGDEVYSAFEGTVRISKYSSSYGNYVIVRHLNGLETLYAHLSSRNVFSGDYVQAGDVLGLGGNTGKSRGSHLHFEVRFLGQQINPRDVISFDDFTCSTDTLAISPNSFDYLKAIEKHKAMMAAARYYRIRKGDTLGKIARNHGTTVSRLCKLNRISKRTILRIGRRIRVA